MLCGKLTAGKFVAEVVWIERRAAGAAVGVLGVRKIIATPEIYLFDRPVNIYTELIHS